MWGFINLKFKLNLKVSAFYLSIPKKKNIFLSLTAVIHPKDGVSRLNFPKGFGLMCDFDSLPFTISQFLDTQQFLVTFWWGLDTLITHTFLTLKYQVPRYIKGIQKFVFCTLFLQGACVTTDSLLLQWKWYLINNYNRFDFTIAIWYISVKPLKGHTSLIEHIVRLSVDHDTLLKGSFINDVRFFRGEAQCVELKLRWRFCVHASSCPEIYF